MRIPDESLDDFNVPTPKPAEPPAVVSVRLTGKIEVLKPLVRGEYLVKSEPAAGGAPVRPAPERLSSFHRSLAIGGAFAVIAFILATGIHIAIFGPPIEQVSPSDVAVDGQPDGIVTPAEELFPSSLVPDVNSPTAFIDGLNTVRPVARRRPVRPRVLRAAYRPKRPLHPPQFLVSNFVPTTLIIYVQNGEIKKRIEPWLTAGYKRS